MFATNVEPLSRSLGTNAKSHSSALSARLFPHRAIPKVQSSAVAESVGPAKRQAHEQTSDAPERVRPQVAPRCDHAICENNEPPLPLEGRDKYRVFRRVMSLAEPASSLKSTPRAEQARAAGLPKHLHAEHKDRIRHSPQTWHTATADSTVADILQRRLDDLSAHQRISIHEDQNIPACLLGSCVACRRNLLMFHSDDTRSVLLRDRRSGVAR
jgi:hypothetical protein